MSSALRQRITTAIIIGIPILALVFYSNVSRLAFLAMVAMAMSWEYLALFKNQLKSQMFKWISLACSIAMLTVAIIAQKDFLQWALPISLIVNAYLIFELLSGKDSLQSKAPAIWNILYISLPLSCLISFSEDSHFAMILISSLFLIWVSDIGAYFVGSSTGKRKLFPSISPGKTWEGFWGGGLLTVLFSYAFFSYYKVFDVPSWAIIAILVWLTGSLGDLVESKIKRHLKVKDSSNIMPGHGGFLDRFDAFIFCLPFVLTFIHYFK